MAQDLSELLAALKSDEVETRRRAAESLAQLGAEAADAAIAIVSACGDEDEQVREWLASALEELEPPSAEHTGKLADFLSQPNEDVTYWAATLLGRMKSQAAIAVPQLAAVVASHPAMTIRRRAAWALSRIGADAASASSVLQEAARSEDGRLAKFAQAALDAIAD